MAARLASLYADLCDVIALHQPDLAAVERVFVAASPRSALVLGQARGAILAAAGGRGLGVSEYTPSQVKHAVVGTGSAAKAQVQSMVQRLLGLSHRPARDAADALAVAICHAHAAHLTSMGVVSRARRGPRRRSGSFVVRRVR